MLDAVDISERRACRLVGLSRTSYREPPEADAQTAALSARIVELAHVEAARLRNGRKPAGQQ